MATNREARHWCFTLNNPTMFPDEVEPLFDLPYTYLVFQLEAGEEETPHYQGYVCFEKKQRLSAIRHIFANVAHWEVCRGTPTQNRAYCTKAETRIGDFAEFGTLPGAAGSRQDLIALHAALQDGLTSAEYAQEYFSLFVRYPNLVTNYIGATVQARENDPVSSWLLIGPPGTGKSRLAHRLGNGLPGGVFRHSLRKWFDGYRGERVIVFDDFCGSSLPFSDFKRIIDRYAVRVELKGSSCEMAATHFIFTTNNQPETWWQQDVLGEHGLAAISRRIGLVVAFVAENQFRLYPTLSHYRLAQRPVPDGQIPIAQTPLQVLTYEEGEALPEAIWQAQVQ
uniref:Replication-associated protein n=1 Tax=Red panda feces-associated circular DNA virus 2 TaxID=2863973 RepID=A0A8K1HHR0_9VIRU|nr:replication-associated protein [Red panda feces-associated circular DNA virus 2]